MLLLTSQGSHEDVVFSADSRQKAVKNKALRYNEPTKELGKHLLPTGHQVPAHARGCAQQGMRDSAVGRRTAFCRRYALR